MRIAFTIILNGLHHLKHNEYYKTVLDIFDYWVIVEGASGSTGSTSWCKTMGDNYHDNGKSIDGTREFLDELSKKYNNLVYIPSKSMWPNKDVQVARVIHEVKKLSNDCFLWEIDIDEQWALDEIISAEQELQNKNGKTGKFTCNCFVGQNLMAVGEWGEGKYASGNGYNRLWNWKGEYFDTHEPPVLLGGNGICVNLPQKFNHYNYYFDKDVKFKNDWYSGHEGIYANWIKINELDKSHFPLHISNLLSGPHGKGNTYIIHI